MAARVATSQQSIFVADVAGMIVRALVSMAIDRSDKFRFGIRHCARLAQTLPAQKCNTFPDILRVYGLAPSARSDLFALANRAYARSREAAAINFSPRPATQFGVIPRQKRRHNGVSDGRRGEW